MERHRDPGGNRNALYACRPGLASYAFILVTLTALGVNRFWSPRLNKVVTWIIAAIAGLDWHTFHYARIGLRRRQPFFSPPRISCYPQLPDSYMSTNTGKGDHNETRLSVIHTGIGITKWVGPWRYYRGWGYRRPCCLFLTLPVLLVPLLALLFLGFRALHVM